MGNKRFIIHLTELEAMSIGTAIENMWTGDGDDHNDPIMKAMNRVEKKIAAERKSRSSNETKDK